MFHDICPIAIKLVVRHSVHLKSLFFRILRLFLYFQSRSSLLSTILFGWLASSIIGLVDGVANLFFSHERLWWLPILCFGGCKLRGCSQLFFLFCSNASRWNDVRHSMGLSASRFAQTAELSCTLSSFSIFLVFHLIWNKLYFFKQALQCFFDRFSNSVLYKLTF